ncbi:MAG TPA: 3-methyl-2-oxobutanoate hydroxymethyltransferase [Xanthomonadales bacterium]|nr:3-methyl-2-oxobutanoate hydroxymethyltransferase [Xanthomonadales bacterium]
MYAAPNDPAAAPVTLRTLAARKAAGEKIVALTAYDASFAALLDANGVDLVLVGDSLGNVVQGLPTTLPVSVDDMEYHCRAVARGLRRAMLAVDLPFASYPEPVAAFANAARLMRAGAAIVKLEGAGHVLDSIRYLSERDVPVCAHLGLTPQSVHALGGYKVQGRDAAAADRLRADALAAQQAGAAMVLFEMVPAVLAGEITRSLSVPTIGIGAGVDCDGQILVGYDMIGLTPGKRPRFAQDFLAGRGSLAEAVRAYGDAVRARTYPSPEQSY